MAALSRFRRFREWPRQLRGLSATSRPDVKFRAIREYAPAAGYLPREVFFGRLALVGAFFSVWASDFGRFFPATSGSFR
jgi:hypothetical protein